MAETRDLLFRFLGDARDLSQASRQAKGDLAGVERQTDKASGGWRGMAASTKLAVGGALAFVGTKVVDFLGESVQNAIADQAAQRQLALALQNTVGATEDQIAATEAWIDKTQAATGIVDDQLRPALADLVRATGSVEQAQEDMGVAMDVATAKGIPLETVIKAMGKAAQGNVAAMGRLGLNVRDAAGDFLTYEEALAEANRTMGGATAAAANEAEGRVRRFRIAVDEAKESLGNFIMEGLGRVAQGAEIVGASLNSAGTQGEQSMRSFEAAVGDVGSTAAGVITVLGTYKGSVEEIMDAADLTAPELLKLRDASDEVMLAAGMTEEEIDDLREMIGRGLVQATEDARTHGLAPTEDAFGDVEGAARGAADGTREYMDSQRALIDPAFAMFDAISRVQSATEKYNEALADGGEDSMEAMDAARDLAGAWLDLDSASLTYAEEGGPASLEAIRDMLEKGGIAKDVIDNMIGSIERYNSTPIKPLPPFFDPGRGDRGRSGRASHVGGHFGPHGVARVGERGAETVVFGPQGGRVIPDAPAAVGPSINNVFHVTGFVGSEARLAAEIDRMLTLRQRRSGLGFQP